MKVLITGATGFLGAHLCRRMVDDGHTVRVLVRPTSSCAALDGLPVERVLGDVTNFHSMKGAVCNQECVIHAAASLTGDEALHQKINVEGTRYVARACRNEGIKRLVHVSSVAAIGIPDDPSRPADENFRFNLNDSGLSYHLSKRRAEEEVMAEVEKGLDAVIVNPASIKGPHGRHYFGAEISRTVRRTRVVPYFTGGICVVHVEDVVNGINAALARGVIGERYILGGENLSFKDIGKKTASALNLRRRFIPLPSLITGVAASVLDPLSRLRGRQPWITYTTHYCACRYQFFDSGKARRNLGYAPRDFEAILEECLRAAAA